MLNKKALNEEINWRINDAMVSVERLEKIYPDIQYFLENYDDTDDPIEGFYYWGLSEIELQLNNLIEGIGNGTDTTELKDCIELIDNNLSNICLIYNSIGDQLIDKNYNHEARVLRNEPLNINAQITWIRNEIR